MATEGITNGSGLQNLDGARSLSKLTKDFDQFLQLLTTQLKNQDPLSPMETHQFTTQLVQFSNVEQSIRQNTLLEAQLKNQTVDQAMASLSLVGKAVEVPNPQTDMKNQEANWRYKIAAGAEKVTLTIKDKDGNIVRVMDGETEEGIHDFGPEQFDGKHTNGTLLPDGIYTLEVESLDAKDKPVANYVRGYGRVTSVDVTGDQPILFVHDKPVNLSDVSRVTN